MQLQSDMPRHTLRTTFQNAEPMLQTAPTAWAASLSLMLSEIVVSDEVCPYLLFGVLLPREPTAWFDLGVTCTVE